MHSRTAVLSQPDPIRPSLSRSNPPQSNSPQSNPPQSNPTQSDSPRFNSPQSSGSQSHAPRLDVTLAAHSQSKQLCEALGSIAGFELTGPYQGWLTVGPRRATVTLEPHHAIRFALPVASSRSAVAALRAASSAPLNVRLARHHRTLELIADARSDRPDLLIESVRGIRHGFLQLLGRAEPVETAERHWEPAAVHATLAQLGWDSQSVIETSRGWELRPRLNDVAVPVQFELDQATSEFCLWRTVLPASRSSDDTRRRALAELALRLNGQFRLARIVDRDGELRCETQVPSALFDAAWLSVIVRAVAVAGQYAEQRLRVIAADPEVAGWYDQMFGDPSDGGSRRVLA